MNRFFFLFLAIFSVTACKKEPKVSAENWQNVSSNVRFREDAGKIQLESGKFKYNFDAKKLPFKKIVLLNASLVGYFTELGLEESIVGISSPEYIYSEKVQQLILAGKIQNVGNEQKYDVEKILALNPDVIFTNHVASFGNTYDLLSKNGIQLIFLDEYLEHDPLEKSAYLKVFGKLLGKEKEAETRFSAIQKSYDSLKNSAKKSAHKPVVLANEMYGNQWFLPGGKTALARFLGDANAAYINADNSDEKAVPMSFEEVFVKAEKAEFWVNVGNRRQKKDLLQINPNYSKMKVYQNGKLYTVSGRERGSANDFFESGVLRADLVLKDYIKIFHPELLPNYQLTFLKPLK